MVEEIGVSAVTSSSSFSSSSSSYSSSSTFSQELEQDMEKMSTVNEKLKNAECEIRTLKSFVVSKTAMVERRKMEILEVRRR